MPEEKTIKIGFYVIKPIRSKSKTIYRIDSGKTIFVARFNKRITNPYREVKDFSTMKSAKDYVLQKLKIYKKKKEKILASIPKSLYLILIKEESTSKVFVKVGITAKRFIMRRFSKKYGYGGYVVDSILRRIDTPYAEKLEKEIKVRLNKKTSIKKYRPVLESFSGYSECFDYICLSEIIKIFDSLTKNIS
jgi:hypothetical protein